MIDCWYTVKLEMFCAVIVLLNTRTALIIKVTSPWFPHPRIYKTNLPQKQFYLDIQASDKLKENMSLWPPTGGDLVALLFSGGILLPWFGCTFPLKCKDHCQINKTKKNHMKYMKINKSKIHSCSKRSMLICHHLLSYVLLTMSKLSALSFKNGSFCFSEGWYSDVCLYHSLMSHHFVIQYTNSN